MKFAAGTSSKEGSRRQARRASARALEAGTAAPAGLVHDDGVHRFGCACRRCVRRRAAALRREAVKVLAIAGVRP